MTDPFGIIREISLNEIDRVIRALENQLNAYKTLKAVRIVLDHAIPVIEPELASALSEALEGKPVALEPNKLPSPESIPYMTEAREEILDLLEKRGKMSCRGVAKALGKDTNNVRQSLRRLLLAGLIDQDVDRLWSKVTNLPTKEAV